LAVPHSRMWPDVAALHEALDVDGLRGFDIAA
jgi:hypothetical protein